VSITPEQLQSLIRNEIECPECGEDWAWLGDMGQSIVVHGRCLACLLFKDSGRTEAEEDAMVDAVMQSRLKYEAETGRRVLPCPACLDATAPGCTRCQSRGWVLGYPPGFGHLSPVR
jgi:predicted RNA-binding Zn-ribbon protein involved in translation (DUF1610 family)